jgi:hypothetical protein
MNKRFCGFLSLVFLWGGVISAPPEARAAGSSPTKHVYRPRRFSARRYSGSRYSPVKFTPRRYTWQRNLGKRVGYRPTPKPVRRTRKRLRLPVRGPNTRRRAAIRRNTRIRRKSRTARVRTARGGSRYGRQLGVSQPRHRPTRWEIERRPSSPYYKPNLTRRQ